MDHGTQSKPDNGKDLNVDGVELVSEEIPEITQQKHRRQCLRIPEAIE